MTTPVAFFLIADDRPTAAPWSDRILTMFSLLHQHAMREPVGELSSTYADTVEKAFTNLPGLAASKQRIVTSRCTGLAAGIHALFASAPGAEPAKQLAFIEAHAMLSLETASQIPADDAGIMPSCDPELGDTSECVSSMPPPACNTANTSPGGQQTSKSPALTWTFFLGVVPRPPRNTAVERTLWIAFVRWEPTAAPKPDLMSKSANREIEEPQNKARTAPLGERLSAAAGPKTDGKAGVLHARILEATLHATFFDHYADRWSRFADNAPPEHIRNNDQFLFIPLKGLTTP